MLYDVSKIIERVPSTPIKIRDFSNDEVYQKIKKCKEDETPFDYEGDIDYSFLKEYDLVKDGGFAIQFGKIVGSFDCSFAGLHTLIKGPEEVEGNFNCGFNYLTSLEGSPKEVGGSFNCTCNEIELLEGVPSKIGGDFDCSGNALTYLKGCPRYVKGNFICNNNMLRTLKYFPKFVGKDFNCSYNEIKSLDGFHSKVLGKLITKHNPLN